jgi:hypothetical protein
VTTPAFSPKHGSKAEVYFNGYDLSIYLSGATTGRSRDKAEATTFKSKTKRYTYGLSDPTMALDGYYDGNKARVDEVMYAALDGEEGVLTHFPYGAGLGARGVSMLSMTTKYEVKSEIGSTVGISIEGSAGPSGLIDNVLGLAQDVVVSAAGQSLSVDYGVTNGKVGLVTVHGITTGGTLTVTLQDSADNTTFADVATVTFTGGSVPNPLRQGKRALTTNPMRRYARVIWSGAGTILIAAVGR